ncbi:YceD family protein [Mycoplasma sp. 06067-C1-B144P-99-0482-3]|uniref:YceD family protein n=1 Tax=Mycoplasma sp. 06067-C1-B144P-99-0482-3 TaxID=3117438 RepID=UPI003DA5D4ED
MKLVFSINDFKTKKHYKLKDELTDLNSYQSNNILIKSYDYISYDLDLDYNESIKTIYINGIINYTITGIDSRIGNEIKYNNSIDWNDEYSFTNNSDFNTNIIISDQFNLLDYIIEQINLNIPFNLSLNNDILKKYGLGWSLESEDDFQHSKNDQIDPRWEQLDNFKLDKTK